MERTLIAVEPDDTGWRIRLGDEFVARHLEKLRAIDRATLIARERHQATGHPTGVHVCTLSGEAVMVGVNG